MPRLRRLVTGINARAITIYLWHLPALYGSGLLLSGLYIAVTRPGGAIAVVAIATVALTLIVMAVGWIEDVAARRRPTLLPAQACNRATTARHLNPNRAAGHESSWPMGRGYKHVQVCGVRLGQ
ncbi:hypothetical protein [Allorhizocola rhizosphaerae]|uniref:hypothetical protein n=1 Tax=Allorhizocola rhizosphaerae TaxID=1872709 RepID=UPI000E3C6B88|nr:hypothetical protein [Allorhizocola rhizosphaerae]